MGWNVILHLLLDTGNPSAVVAVLVEDITRGRRSNRGKLEDSLAALSAGLACKTQSETLGLSLHQSTDYRHLTNKNETLFAFVVQIQLLH